MNFIENKYTKWYFKIIENRKVNTLIKSEELYTEVHHIIPRSLGGSNEKENLVRLTAREHYIVHWLLTKMTVNEAKGKMICAFWLLTVTSKKDRIRNITSRQYDSVKQLLMTREVSIETRDKLRMTKIGDKNPMYNKSISEETREKIREAGRNRIYSEESKEKRLRTLLAQGKTGPTSGQKQTEEHKKKIAESHKGEKNHFYGKKHSEESKKKMSEKATGRKLSEETKEYLRKINTGKKMSPEAIAKSANSRKGMKLTEECKQKISQAKKGKKLSSESIRKREETKRKNRLEGK